MDNMRGALIQFYPLMDDDRSIPVAAPFVFPVGALEEIAYEASFDHTDYTTIAAGEFSRAYARKLRTVSFETMLVEHEYSWSYNVGSTVDKMAATLRKYCEEGRTFELLIVKPLVTSSGTLTEYDDGTILRMPATMRSLRVTEKSGEPDTKYLSISCSEYRRPVLTTGQAPKRPGNKTGGPWTLTMQYKSKGKDWAIACTPRDSQISALAKGKNDTKVTLRSIARALYGKDGDKRIDDILKANQGLGKKWGATTPLEKNKFFSSGKKRTFKVPK